MSGVRKACRAGPVVVRIWRHSHSACTCASPHCDCRLNCGPIWIEIRRVLEQRPHRNTLDQ